MMDGYKLSRQWFDFTFENTDKVTANHIALYMWLVEINNRLGWKKEFQITSSQCMEGMCCKTYKTYKKCLDDLIEWGFVVMVKQSKNQYQCNVIGLVILSKAMTNTLSKALDNTVIKAQDKALTEALPIFNKQLNKEPRTTKQFVPPSVLEVQNYFKENGYLETVGEKAFKYYDTANWHDSKGNKIKNWKQKMHGAWFKDENKITIYSPSETVKPKTKVPEDLW